MPRITSATVAEHRVAQRGAILRAAAELVLADGVTAVTPTAVADRAGIARTSVYDYFHSREDLLVAVALNAFGEWDRDLAAALEDVDGGLPRLLRYLEATMGMAADGRHDLAAALRFTDLSPQRAEEIAALHDALQEPLLTILGEAGVADPAETTPYIQALIGAGLKRVSAGGDPHEVASRIHRIAIGGVLGVERPEVR